MLIMRLLTFAFSALIAGQAQALSDHRSEAHIETTASVGGPHGTEVCSVFSLPQSVCSYCQFNDARLVGNVHRRISRVTLTGGCHGARGRLTRLELEYRDNRDVANFQVIDHGTALAGSKPDEIKLDTDEFITGLELSTFKQEVGRLGLTKWTRVGWMRVSTSKGKSVECGMRFDSGILDTMNETICNGRLTSD